MPSANEAFQWIINNAAGMSIDGRGTVAQTATRENVVRSISRGGRVWRFSVTPSPGKTLAEARPYLAKLDQMDRIIGATVSLNHPGFEAINGYQGAGSSGFTVTVPAGTGVTQVTLTAAALGSGLVARAGDWLQIGINGTVYQVVEDPAPGNGASVRLNRPVDQAAGTYTGLLGANVSWRVVCVERPTWNLVPAGANMLVQWSGDFVFFEDRT
jgi:hypothetical protein